MSETKHTPGRWSIARDPRPGMDWNSHIVDKKRGHAICFMAHSDGASPERDEANARLIAAAPDLLEALRAVDVLFGHLATDSTQRIWLDNARAAIAKATTGV